MCLSHLCDFFFGDCQHPSWLQQVAKNVQNVKKNVTTLWATCRLYGRVQPPKESYLFLIATGFSTFSATCCDYVGSQQSAKKNSVIGTGPLQKTDTKHCGVTQRDRQHPRRKGIGDVSSRDPSYVTLTEIQEFLHCSKLQ